QPSFASVVRIRRFSRPREGAAPRDWQSANVLACSPVYWRRRSKLFQVAANHRGRRCSETPMRTWKTLLLTRPDFQRLWLSGVISLVGDWLSFVAVSVLTLEHGGGALGLAVVLAAHGLPQVLASPIAGVVADR